MKFEWKKIEALFLETRGSGEKYEVEREKINK